MGRGPAHPGPFAVLTGRGGLFLYLRGGLFLYALSAAAPAPRSAVGDEPREARSPSGRRAAPLTRLKAIHDLGTMMQAQLAAILDEAELNQVKVARSI